MIVVRIDTENAAFAENASEEVARILRSAAFRVEGGQESGNLFDINGNLVGIYGEE